MKKLYKEMNEHINPASDLSDLVLERAKPGRLLNLRPLIAVAAVLALLVAAMPVMAENVPLVHDALNLVDPELADRLVPVQLSDSDNGITMEVVAASVHDNVAEWVIKLEGDELAKWTIVTPLVKIKDHCGVLGMTTRTSGENLTDYEGYAEDRANGIVYYSYQKTYPEGTTVEQILGDKMTVKLSGVILTNIDEEGVEVPVIFTDYELMTVVYERWNKDYGFAGFGYRGDPKEEYTLMTPGESVYDVTDKLALTGAAYIDGQLHIQTVGVDQTDWWYWFPHFLDAEGNKIQPIDYANFGFEEDGREIEYQECVYDIPEEELANHTMRIVIQDDEAISSQCSVTFKIADVMETTE